MDSEGIEILSYFTFIDKAIRCVDKHTIKDICENDSHLHFKYYTSPQKRREYILKANHGSEYEIWHDGWLEEYKLSQS